MAYPDRQLPVRRIKFRYPSGSLRHHYVDDDLIMSHVVAVLSATFPPGEDFFIRSVQHYADKVTDPVLKAQVKGFIGQEVTHGREHRELNRQLQEMGYPTHRVARFVKWALADATKRAPAKLNLSYTAALEHYTATLAECLLTKPEAQRLLGDTEVRNILLWHALEETEHKAVAFDVYRTIGGSEWIRRFGFLVQSFGLIGLVLIATILSMLGDRATYNPVRLFRSIARLRKSPFLEPDVAKSLGDYLRKGFHPSDHDNEELLDTWTVELFGPEGKLADHLH
ncbi:metal-dependent hydrolase [Nocardioides humilatus]|uniref:Metal-dependent hydrolase n=1 Tax=Nocardioides humilatus TaxID=2607660 RepID=A0A5B1LEW0_9ACTN|nr:metal-dependent hydrolase [Nocardioides humilatus]KAA1418748.1 metal-dependent hydrolase [Nocardioides humilatus]